MLEVVGQPRFFQWNLIHHPWLKYACLHIDGVLCADPTADENDDGERYHRFLTTAPLYVASQTIGWLVTSRLEKHRARTEQWLANQGIQYDNLIMQDVASNRERQRLNAYLLWSNRLVFRSPSGRRMATKEVGKRRCLLLSDSSAPRPARPILRAGRRYGVSLGSCDLPRMAGTQGCCRKSRTP